MNRPWTTRWVAGAVVILGFGIAALSQPVYADTGPEISLPREITVGQPLTVIVSNVVNGPFCDIWVTPPPSKAAAGFKENLAENGRIVLKFNTGHYRPGTYYFHAECGSSGSAHSSQLTIRPVKPATIGLTTAPSALRAQAVRELGLRSPAGCYSMEVARSSQDWALVGYSRYAASNPDVCDLADGSTIATRTSGAWAFTDLSGSVFGCSTFERNGGLADLGAPASVVRDFRYDFTSYCDPSY